MRLGWPSTSDVCIGFCGDFPPVCWVSMCSRRSFYCLQWALGSLKSLFDRAHATQTRPPFKIPFELRGITFQPKWHTRINTRTGREAKIPMVPLLGFELRRKALCLCVFFFRLTFNHSFIHHSLLCLLHCFYFLQSSEKTDSHLLHTLNAYTHTHTHTYTHLYPYSHFHINSQHSTTHTYLFTDKDILATLDYSTYADYNTHTDRTADTDTWAKPQSQTYTHIWLRVKRWGQNRLYF